MLLYVIVAVMSIISTILVMRWLAKRSITPVSVAPIMERKADKPKKDFRDLPILRQLEAVGVPAHASRHGVARAKRWVHKHGNRTQRAILQMFEQAQKTKREKNEAIEREYTKSASVDPKFLNRGERERQATAVTENVDAVA